MDLFGDSFLNDFFHQDDCRPIRQDLSFAITHILLPYGFPDSAL